MVMLIYKMVTTLGISMKMNCWHFNFLNTRSLSQEEVSSVMSFCEKKP